MGRKANTKIKVVLEINAEDHQKLSYAAFNNGKGVNEYTLDLISTALIAQNLKPAMPTTADLFPTATPLTPSAPPVTPPAATEEPKHAEKRKR